MLSFCGLHSAAIRIAVLVSFFAVASCCNADDQEPTRDAAAEKRLRTMTEYMAKLKTISVDATHTLETDVQGEGEVKQSDFRRILIESPNRFLVEGTNDSEGVVVSDGKRLLAYLPSYERYLLVESPESLKEAMQQEAAMLMGTGRTIIQLAAGGDAYQKFVRPTTSVALLEAEAFDDVVCDRIELTEDRTQIVMWVEQGDRPLLRKMQWQITLDVSNADFKMPSQFATYSNWDVDSPIDDEAFAIAEPEDAEQVDTLIPQREDHDGPHPLVGQAAPAAELAVLDGETHKLADFKGKKVVVLDFWATWCGPCIEALPIVDKVATKLADKDVAFFAVNLGDELDSVREFLDKHELKLPVAHDADSELAALFDANSIPMTAIIDKQGVVQVVHVGFGSDMEETLTEEVEAVLAGKQLAEETLQAAREAKRWGDPIPFGEDAITAKDAKGFRLEFNLRTSVEAYKNVGSNDDAWDEQAIKFLTEMARHFSGSEGYKSRTELIEIAEPLAEMGCDDPLVKYCHGAMLMDEAKDKPSKARGLRFVHSSYAGLVEKGYPASRSFAAAKRIWKQLKTEDDNKEEAEKYLELAKQHALETLLLDDLENHDGHALYDYLNGFASSLPMDQREEFCEEAKAHEEASPFLINMLAGDYHIRAAWNSRGGGFAPEVTDEGWKGFGEHMTLARAALEKAWEAAPQHPVAAAKMIRVAMASSRSSLSEMRLWFDRAVAAQVDYRDAYTNLAFGLMPRWHGSHDRMYQFGLECIATDRYDTDIPYQLCDNLWRIMRDDHNSSGNRYVRKPGIYENVRTVCQNYVDRGIIKSNVPWWKTVWLGFAYLAEEWDDAGRLLEELDSDLNTDALGRFPISADEVISAVHLNTSPHAETITQAFSDARRGREEQAIAALTEVLDDDQLQPLVATQVRSRLQAMEWSAAFEAGDEVDLLPEANLYGWKIVAGDWKQTPDGGLRGVSDQGGVMLQCQTNFGTHWELSGEIVHGKSPYNAWDAGILLLEDGRPQHSVMFNPTKKWVAAARHKQLKKHQHDFEPDGKTTSFVIRVSGDTINVWLNDDLVVEDEKVEYLGYSDTNRLAIGAKYTWSGSTLTYRKLKIEQLEADE